MLLAQDVSNEYVPKNLDSLKIYLKTINQNQIQRVEGEFSSKIKKLYKDRDERIIKSIEDSTYIFHSELKKNLNGILSHIYSSNPEIDYKDYYFFINNSMVPNAVCYGDGMFEIYLGLLTKVDSDDELAYTICHEIAHKLLDHSLKGIYKRYAVLNSEDTKKRVEEIKKSEYGRARAALSVIDELSINILDYSKEVESEADSLGYILFSKTQFNKRKALSALNKLKRVDDMVFYHEIKIDSVFNFESYPFRSFWLKKRTSLFDTTEKINDFQLVSDTVKTHPEIAFRVEKLVNNFDIPNPNISSDGSVIFLNKIKPLAHKQSIESAYDLNYLDLAIYQLIEKFEYGHIDSDYYYTKMAMVLKRIYDAKKKHDLGKYVPTNNDFFDEKQLNIIRLFLHNMELGEVKKMGMAFCQSNKPKIKDSRLFEEIHSFFKEINNQ